MSSRPLRKLSLVAAVGLSCALPALSQQVQFPAPQFAPPNLTPRGVAGLAMNCAICHGPGGRPVAGSGIPALAGRPEREVVEAMRQFKEGSRAGTLMSQIAKGYSDEEIVAMARHFSALGAKAPR